MLGAACNLICRMHQLEFEGINECWSGKDPARTCPAGSAIFPTKKVIQADWEFPPALRVNRVMETSFVADGLGFAETCNVETLFGEAGPGETLNDLGSCGSPN